MILTPAAFESWTPPPSPNWALVAPPGRVPGSATRRCDSPVFGVGPADLMQALAQALAALPRTRIVERSEEDRALAGESRSAVFGFVDRIEACAVPLDGGGSALWLLSRSLAGYWDVNVNPRRVAVLLAALTETLGSS